MASKPERVLSSLDRAVQQAIGDHRELGSSDDPAKVKFPELWKWLATVYIGKDYLKTPATLTIRLGADGCVVSLADKDLQVSLDVLCSSLEEAFPALERALASPNPAMKSWGRKEPKLRRRKGS